MKEQIDTLTKQVIKELETSNWSKEWDEGFLSIPMIWTDVEKIIEDKDIDTEILKDFFDKDPVIIQEIKKTLLKALKREINNTITKNISLLNEKNDIV